MFALIRRHPFIAAFSAALIAFVLYLPSVHFPFLVMDDGILIMQNPLIQDWNLQTIKEVFTSYDPELYIPLTFISYHFDYIINGLDPSVFHFSNILYHSINTLLVFCVIMLLAEDAVVALLCALLFAVHPVNVETVSWASARKDLLSTMFFLLSLTFFLQYRRSNTTWKWRWYIAALVAFLLAISAKVTVIMLPLALPLLDFYLDRTISKKRLLEYIPFFVISVIFGIIAVLGKKANLSHLAISDYPLLAAKSTLFGLKLLLVPNWYSILYPQGLVAWSSPLFLTCFIGVLCLGVFAIYSWKKWPAIGFGLSFFLLFYLPTFLTFSKDWQVYISSDRYVYIGEIGIFLMVALGLRALMRRLEQRSSAAATVASVLIVCGFVGLAAKTYAQQYTWRDPIALFSNVLAHYPDSAFAYNNIGSEYMDRKDYQNAASALQQAIAVDPHFIVAWMNLATLYRNQGKNDIALEKAQEAIAAIPTDRPPLQEELLPYYLLADIENERGNHEEAIRLLTEAADRGPTVAQAQYNLGMTLQDAGKTDDAIAAYKKAVALDPKNIDAHYGLAAVLSEKGLLREALKELQIVADMNPHYEEVQKHMLAIEGMLNDK